MGYFHAESTLIFNNDMVPPVLRWVRNSDRAVRKFGDDLYDFPPHRRQNWFFESIIILKLAAAAGKSLSVFIYHHKIIRVRPASFVRPFSLCSLPYCPCPGEWKINVAQECGWESEYAGNIIFKFFFRSSGCIAKHRKVCGDKRVKDYQRRDIERHGECRNHAPETCIKSIEYER